MIDFLSAIPVFTGYFLPAIIGGFAAFIIYHNVAPKHYQKRERVPDESDPSKSKMEWTAHHKPSTKSAVYALLAFVVGVLLALGYIYSLGAQEALNLENLVSGDLRLKAFNVGTQAAIAAGYALLGFFAWDIGGAMIKTLGIGIGKIFSLKGLVVTGVLVMTALLFLAYSGVTTQQEWDELSDRLIGLILGGGVLIFGLRWLLNQLPGSTPSSPSKGGGGHH